MRVMFMGYIGYLDVCATHKGIYLLTAFSRSYAQNKHNVHCISYLDACAACKGHYQDAYEFVLHNDDYFVIDLLKRMQNTFSYILLIQHMSFPRVNDDRIQNSIKIHFNLN